MTKYADLASLPEDDRITIIGQQAEVGGLTGFFVDDDAKADRYLAKLTTRFKVELVDRHRDAPVPGAVFVRIRRRADA
jgi:aconitase A